MGIPQRVSAEWIVRSLAAVVRFVVVARMSRSNSSNALARDSSSKTRGKPTKRRANRPGASALRPGRATLGGERERPESCTRGKDDEDEEGKTERRDPPDAKAFAAALALLTKMTGGLADHPDIGAAGDKSKTVQVKTKVPEPSWRPKELFRWCTEAPTHGEETPETKVPKVVPNLSRLESM